MDQNNSANLTQTPPIIPNSSPEPVRPAPVQYEVPQTILVQPAPAQAAEVPPQSPVVPVEIAPVAAQPNPVVTAESSLPPVQDQAAPTVLAQTSPPTPELPPESVISPPLAPVKLPVSRPVLIAIGIAALLIIGLGLFLLFRPKAETLTDSGSTKTSSGSKTSAPKKSTEATLLAAKIAVDTDADAIPDFVETAVGLDPAASELKRCEVADCSKSGKAGISTKNTLIILDSSGSMGLNSGSSVKMTEAKTAIKNFISTVQANENIGLMVYGHKGSNSAADKPASCASAEVIGAIGSVNPASIDGYLNQIQPVGWTPIGLAIERAIPAFAGKEGQNNQIIIVSDGNETCGTDPAGKAALAQASALKIQVNVIGFAVAATEYDALSAISKSGGGTFMTANSSSELEAQFEANHKNVENFIADATCITGASSDSFMCLRDTVDKVQEYLRPLVDQNLANGEIYDLYRILNDAIFKKYYDQIEVVQNSSTQQVNEQQSKLLNQ